MPGRKPLNDPWKASARTLSCWRCGYRWLPRPGYDGNPKACPGCRKRLARPGPRYPLACRACGHRWKSVVAKPVRCPAQACQSAFWKDGLPPAPWWRCTLCGERWQGLRGRLKRKRRDRCYLCRVVRKGKAVVVPCKGPGK